jgi:hypothetical protein
MFLEIILRLRSYKFAVHCQVYRRQICVLGTCVSCPICHSRLSGIHSAIIFEKGGNSKQIILMSLEKNLSMIQLIDIRAYKCIVFMRL